MASHDSSEVKSAVALNCTYLMFPIAGELAREVKMAAVCSVFTPIVLSVTYSRASEVSMDWQTMSTKLSLASLSFTASVWLTSRCSKFLVLLVNLSMTSGSMGPTIGLKSKILIFLKPFSSTFKVEKKSITSEATAEEIFANWRVT